ncbi:MAG: tRNA-dihydrouridine synthase family protein [Ruminococcaceae bacterium]|nr:tRNA-dihydrouridine synthase family protein [Oscillospiraceae bacterium]
MKLYAAPLEGMTNYLWRRIHARIFGGAQRYFTPFVSPNATCKFQTKELDELRHNEGMEVVPQILTNNAEHFLWAAREMADMGYREINFNLGCPSGTVTAKRKGAGMLSYPEDLQRLLEEIFAGLPQEMKVSVKTRIGKESVEEWPYLLGIYNQFPLSELIVHPRVQKEFYRGHAHREVVEQTLAKTKVPLCYNGDIFSPTDANVVVQAYPALDALMMGRGLMADPALLRRIQGGAAAGREELRQYHDALWEAYRVRLGGDLNAIYRMREQWNYLSGSFVDTDAFLKKVRKAKSGAEYMAAVERLFAENELCDSPRPPEGK